MVGSSVERLPAVLSARHAGITLTSKRVNSRPDGSRGVIEPLPLA